MVVNQWREPLKNSSCLQTNWNWFSFLRTEKKNSLELESLKKKTALDDENAVTLRQSASSRPSTEPYRSLKPMKNGKPLKANSLRVAKIPDDSMAMCFWTPVSLNECLTHQLPCHWLLSHALSLRKLQVFNCISFYACFVTFHHKIRTPVHSDHPQNLNKPGKNCHKHHEEKVDQNSVSLRKNGVAVLTLVFCPTFSQVT